MVAWRRLSSPWAERVTLPDHDFGHGLYLSTGLHNLARQ